MNNKFLLTTVRRIAFLEGLSLLVLLCIAMPLKYIWEMPEMVQRVGMAHGVLFIAYVILVVLAKVYLNWSNKLTIIAFIASFIPFGTFYVDAKYFKNNAISTENNQVLDMPD